VSVYLVGNNQRGRQVKISLQRFLLEILSESTTRYPLHFSICCEKECRLIESVRGEASSHSNEVNSTQPVEFCRKVESGSQSANLNGHRFLIKLHVAGSISPTSLHVC